MKTFNLNGKIVEQKEIDFNVICDWDEQGISLDDIQKKYMSTLRAYIALCLDTDFKTAGEEIQEYVVGGGAISDLFDKLSDALKDSGFFQAQRKGKKAKTPTDTQKKEA